MPYLKEVTFHGRGGMGAVTAAELLAEAAAFENKYSQAFPYFGSERRGAPVRAFARISDEAIALRSEVYEPDHVVVLDSSLMSVVDVASGLKSGGYVIVNSTRSSSDLASGLSKQVKVAAIDATGIAQEELGVPITNTTMLGAFAGVTHEIGLEALRKATLAVFSEANARKNIRAIERAYGLP
jgi:pyruvate ferredoxin oxidoreductase gamma subunit